MKSQASHALRLGGALLLAAAVVAACGRDGATTQAPAPVTPVVESTAAPVVQPTIEVAMTDDPGLPTVDGPTTPAATYSAPAPANDPVTSDLRTIDQLINDVNASLSGANAGGE